MGGGVRKALDLKSNEGRLGKIALGINHLFVCHWEVRLEEIEVSRKLFRISKMEAEAERARISSVASYSTGLVEGCCRPTQIPKVFMMKK